MDLLDKCNFKYLIENKDYHWVNNDSVEVCSKCNGSFGLFSRKHHCRYCGNIICYYCQNIVDLHNIRKMKIKLCNQCKDFIIDLENNWYLVNIFSQLDLDIFDYYKLLLIKKWRIIGQYFISSFRNIQYNLDGGINLFEKKILQNNHKYFAGHSIWIEQLMKYNINNIDSDILYKEKNISCKLLRCNKSCRHTFSVDQSIDCLFFQRTNNLYRKYIYNCITNLNTDELLPFIPYIVYHLQYEDSAHLFNILCNLGESNYLFLNTIFWELTLQMIDNNEFYTLKRSQLLKDNSFKHDINKGFQLMFNLKSVLDIKDKDVNEIIKHHIKEIDYEKQEIYMPLNINYIFKSIIFEKVKILNSQSKPILLPCIIHNKEKDENFMKYYLYKSEDLRKDKIIVSIISLVDTILKLKANLDLKIIKYNVLPITKDSGFIEIVDDAETIFNINKCKKFSILNYILENNSDMTIDQIRDNFTKSCAAYSVISYLLGFGDRHLDNIMVTKSGILFHIDFSFIMGEDPKMLSPEIRVIPEMIDAMGGQNSKHYEQFKQYCTICYNTLRQYYGLFKIQLSMLYKYRDLEGKYNQEWINRYIINRFLPFDDHIDATIFIHKKIQSSSDNLSVGLIDFFHEKNKTLKSYFV
tara:strand:+ start:3040 stop:4950 length:1911 start_codon:yes stop_codon:yes gene_type:complete